MRLLTAAVFTSLVLFHCFHDNNNPAAPEAVDIADPTTGSIKGQVQMVGREDEDADDPVMLTIMGTNVFLITDSNGFFEIQYLNAGSYELTLNPFSESWDTTLIVVVTAGVQNDLGVITITGPQPGSTEENNYYSFSVSYKADTSAGNYYQSMSYPSNDPDTINVYSDSIWFRISAYNSDDDNYEIQYTLKIDSVVVYTGTTIKLAGYFTHPVGNGYHLYEFYQGENLIRRNMIYKAEKFGSFFKLELRNGPDPYFYSSSYPDMDLMLVNQAGDTCYFRNSNPDWGQAGNKADDPDFRGDETSFSSSSTEEIIFQNIPDGVYTIYVQNFYNPQYSQAGSRYAYPSLNFTVNDSDFSVNYQGTLAEGQQWLAGTITAPAMSFQSIDSTLTFQVVELDSNQVIVNPGISSNLNIYFKTDSSENFQQSFYGYSSRIDTHFVYGDSIYFRVLAGSPDPKNYEIHFSLNIDGVLTYSGSTVKLTAYFVVPVAPGPHLYEFYRAGVLTNKAIINKPVITGKNSRVEVWNALTFPSTSPDLDLMLVNAQGDTCFYKNPNPDWGVQADYTDDPLFGGDVSSFSYSSYSEYIEFNIIPDGVYSIIVHNFYHPDISLNGPQDAIPAIEVTLGEAVFADTLVGDTLRAGGVWMPGVIRVPEMVYQKTSSIVYSADRARIAKK